MDLVMKLRQADPSRKTGAIAAAARQIGIPQNQIGRWLLQRDLVASAAGAAPPSDPRGQASRTPLLGLIGCAWCGKDMIHRQVAVTGAPVFVCPPGCARRQVLPATDLDRVVGQMLLQRLTPWATAARNQMTAVAALQHAPATILRIVVGHRASDLRVQWRSLPPMRRASTSEQRAAHPAPGERYTGGYVDTPRPANTPVARKA
jgi:hypothetical protein